MVVVIMVPDGALRLACGLYGKSRLDWRRGPTPLLCHVHMHLRLLLLLPLETSSLPVRCHDHHNTTATTAPQHTLTQLRPHIYQYTHISSVLLIYPIHNSFVSYLCLCPLLSSSRKNKSIERVERILLAIRLAPSSSVLQSHHHPMPSVSFSTKTDRWRSLLEFYQDIHAPPAPFCALYVLHASEEKNKRNNKSGKPSGWRRHTVRIRHPWI